MGTPLRVLIAPDKFKGTLSAHAAAHAMADGVRHAVSTLGIAADIDLCPIADGGEGTAEILAQAWQANPSTNPQTTAPAWHQATVTGPCDHPVLAQWFVSPPTRAVFDSASACGLSLVPTADRNPATCTTRGVGELILQAAASGTLRELLIGLGGTATIDAGIGMAAALGWRFNDASGRPIDAPVGADLSRIATATPPTQGASATAHLRGLQIRVLCDVSTALLGSSGCAARFGPQKGATQAQVQELEAGLRHLTAITAVPPIERDGAAGGLAYALRVFAGHKSTGASVTLESGAAAVLEAVAFDTRAAQADFVLTGEGRFDATSLEGKAVGEVLARSRRLGKRVIVIAGSLDGPRTPSLDERVVMAECPGSGMPATADEAAARVREAAAATSLRILRNKQSRE